MSNVDSIVFCLFINSYKSILFIGISTISPFEYSFDVPSTSANSYNIRAPISLVQIPNHLPIVPLASFSSITSEYS